MLDDQLTRKHHIKQHRGKWLLKAKCFRTFSADDLFSYKRVLHKFPGPFRVHNKTFFSWKNIRQRKENIHRTMNENCFWLNCLKCLLAAWIICRAYPSGHAFLMRSRHAVRVDLHWPKIYPLGKWGSPLNAQYGVLRGPVTYHWTKGNINFRLVFLI